MSSPDPLLPRVTAVARPIERSARRRSREHGEGADGAGPDVVSRRRRVRRVVLKAVLGGTLVLVLAGVWVGVRAATAVSGLMSAAPAIEDIAGSLSDEPSDTVLTSVQEVRDAVAGARDAVGDPVWRVAEVLPGVGDRLEAVRSAVTAADILAQDALGPVVSLAGSVTFGPYEEEGQGYAALVEARELDDDLAAIADAVQRAHAQVSDLPATDLFVAAATEPFEEALGALDQAADVASVLRPGLAGMLEMTGYSGQARTLVVVLDARVPRALGGAVERAYLVTAEHGAVGGVEPVDVGALVAVAGQAEHEASVPAAAAALRAGVEQVTGSSPDAVVMLSLEGLDMLSRIAVVPEARNAVDALPRLAGALAGVDAATRAALIDHVTGATFQALLGLTARADDLALTVRDAVAAGALRVWFADPELQDPLALTLGAGALPASTTHGIPLTVTVDATGPHPWTVAGLTTWAGVCGSWWDEHPVVVAEVAVAPAEPAEEPVESAAGDGAEAAAEGSTRLLVGLPTDVAVRWVGGPGREAEIPWEESLADGHRVVAVTPEAGTRSVRLVLDARAGQPHDLLVLARGGVPEPTDAELSCP